MSGVGQIQTLSKSRRARDTSSFIHWPYSPPPRHSPSLRIPHSVNACEPPSLPVTPVTILSRSSSLPSSLFRHDDDHHHHHSAAVEQPSKIPGAGRTPAVQREEQDRNKTFQRKKCSQLKIRAAGVGEQQREASVEVTIVQANGNKETKKLVTGSKKALSTSKQHEKVAGSNRKHTNGLLQRSPSQPINARSRGARKLAELEDEKWAGPAYSKSPPPSSLPFPKFSVPSRALSMDAAVDAAENSSSSSSSNISSSSINGSNSSSSGSTSSSNSSSGGSPTPEHIATTANRPTSPSPEAAPCNCWDAAFATEDLKRILNLDQQVTT